MVEKTGIRNEVAILDPQPGPDPAARIQDGDLITNSGFFDHPSACEQAPVKVVLLISCSSNDKIY